MTIWFDDLVVGTVEHFGRYEVTRGEAIEFASKYAPEPIHMDDEAASRGVFGRLTASGWHTGAMAMNMVIRHWQETGFNEASLGGAGMDELRWTHPVYPGDILSCEVTLIEKTASRSKPDRGITKSQWRVCNQAGDTVMTLISTGIVRRRPAADH